MTRDAPLAVRDGVLPGRHGYRGDMASEYPAVGAAGRHGARRRASSPTGAVPPADVGLRPGVGLGLAAALGVGLAVVRLALAAGRRRANRSAPAETSASQVGSTQR